MKISSITLLTPCKATTKLERLPRPVFSLNMTEANWQFKVVIHGMSNMDIKQRVLSCSGNGVLETLTDLVNYISAEESALTETASLSTPSSSLSRIRQSTYKSGKSQPSQSPCKFCGETRHTPANTSEDRRKHCKAFEKTCSKCQKQHHFASVCQSDRPLQTSAVHEGNDGIIGSITRNNLDESETFAYPKQSLH